MFCSGQKLGNSFFSPSNADMCVCRSSVSEIRAVWSVLQPHVDLGEFIGSSETEDPVEVPAVVPNTEEGPAPLAMWEAGVQYIELEKGSKGLGFSILDYQVNKCYL